MSGRYALQDRQVLAGRGAWVEAVNGGSEVDGAGGAVPVRLVFYDDASSPARATERAAHAAES